jgi:hypothetical protein
MVALVEATAFFSLDGLSGKDFERVWVLLVFAHLQLQHNVRVGNSAMHFWPRDSMAADLAALSARRQS